MPSGSSNVALSHIRKGLEEIGFVIEAGRSRAAKIHRPVLFGEKGGPLVNYEIDGWHEGEKIALEIEPGRGMKGNAFYRDLVRTSSTETW